jgi:hypothetical protein
VTVAASATTTNANIGDLVSDVHNAFVNAKKHSDGTTVDISSKIDVESVGTAAMLLRIKNPALSMVEFSSALDNPTVTELGLADEATITPLLIAAGKDVPLLAGRLLADTTLISIDGGPAIPVTIYADDTATNTTILNLVADINQALRVPAIKSGALTGFAPALT